MAPQPPPMQAQTNGRKNRMLTPKIAGSVIPIKADSEDGSAIDFSLPLRVLSATASAAAPCAMFAAEASGSQ